MRTKFFTRTQRSLAALMIFISLSAPLLAASSGKKAKPVIIAPVTEKVIHDKLEALGTTRAIDSIEITSIVTEKVDAIHFTDGQSVSKGQLLVELHRAEQQAELKRAQAIKGERQLTLQRLLKLDKQKLTSPDLIDRTRLELQQAEASIQAIQARINDRMIRAPFDGIVGLRNISVGSLVETGDLITTLDDISKMYLDFSVPTLYLSDIQPGLKLKAENPAFPDTPFEGEVNSLSSRVDPVSRSVIVRALIANPERQLLPGLLMQVDLLRNQRNSLMIAEAAILPLADKQFVMRVVDNDNDKSCEKVQIQTGARIPGFIEVLQGLKPGDQVVTHGNDKIKAGDLLKITGVDDGTVDIAELLKSSQQQP